MCVRERERERERESERERERDRERDWTISTEKIPDTYIHSVSMYKVLKSCECVVISVCQIRYALREESRGTYCTCQVKMTEIHEVSD